MNFANRVKRHISLTANTYKSLPEPRFVTLFINSICNMKCEHCFYWTSLNQKDDLTFEEIVALSESMGQIENLNLSGGEPFLRKEFAEVCHQFINHNGVKQIYVPTNGYFTDKMVEALTKVLENKQLELFVVEISLDGMPEFHDTFRVAKNSFKKAMESYEALVELQKTDSRLRIHCISTATDTNMAELKKLSTYLVERCPNMDHHSLAIIRGDRKNPDLAAPILNDYVELYNYIQRLWAKREEGRYGGIVEPMLQWTKVKTIKEQRQVVSCLAGRLSMVIYANGDVSLCETHDPIGNLRQNTFPEIWESEAANKLRASIRNKECHCTSEISMWSSIVYQPNELVKVMVGGQVWKQPTPLADDEMVRIEMDEEQLPVQITSTLIHPSDIGVLD